MCGSPIWGLNRKASPEKLDNEKPILIPNIHQRVCLNVTDADIQSLKHISEKAPEQATRDKAKEVYAERVSMKKKGDQLRQDFCIIMGCERFIY